MSRKLNDSRKMVTLRHRVREISLVVVEEDRLCNKASTAIDYLLRYKYFSYILEALKNLGKEGSCFLYELHREVFVRSLCDIVYVGTPCTTPDYGKLRWPGTFIPANLFLINQDKGLKGTLNQSLT